MPRPRSVRAHNRVIESALELIATRGLDATSMDSIAERSGVSKATIYKHWANKEALLLEVMAYVNGLHSRPSFDSGDTRQDIIGVLSYRPPEHAEIREVVMPQFMAYSVRNEAFGSAWRNMVMEPPRRELRRLLRQAVDRRELSAELNIDMSLALLLGPMLYWHVFLRKTTSDPDRLARAVVDAFWRAFENVRSSGQPGATRKLRLKRNGLSHSETTAS